MAKNGEPRKRIGIREIAKEARVSLMTVSLALRDNPKISKATRARIQKLAKQLGYRPDPKISQLMSHLRAGRSSQGTIGLAIVDFYPGSLQSEHPYNARIRSGISARAGQLGFNVNLLRAVDYNHNLAQIVKVIRSRGIDGIILLPPASPMAMPPAVDWAGLSVVASTSAILSPRFHRVIPHQFFNMMNLIERSAKDGYRTICTVLDQTFDDRTAHHFTAALKWHGHGDRVLILPDDVSVEAKIRRVAQWISAHRPDLIFAQSPELVNSIVNRKKTSARLQKAEIVALGKPKEEGFAYLDETPEAVGSAAVDLLAGMIHYNETGIPEHPRTTMIDGIFHAGKKKPTPRGKRLEK